MEFTPESKPTVFTLLGGKHSNDDRRRLELNRRRLLNLGVASIVAASVPGPVASRAIGTSVLLSTHLAVPRSVQFDSGQAKLGVQFLGTSWCRSS
jgi:hypothetical protein